ncbi:hypothetical protein D3C78_1076130 [compost metagenome]
MKGVAIGVRLAAGDRILEVPGEVFAGSGERLTFEGRFIAQSDDVVETLAGKLVQRLAVQRIGGHSQVLQGAQGAWIDRRRRSAGAEGGEMLVVGVTQQGFGHLRTRRVGGADEQHADLVAHHEARLRMRFGEYIICHM